MHVARIKSSHVDKAGLRHDYESVYLRRSYRDGGKVRHEQLSNLSALPAAAITAIEAVLSGRPLAPVGAGLEITRSLPHGHVAAITAQAAALGFPGLLGPPGRARDIALALVVARVARPGSKLATTRWWADTTLARDLGVADATLDDVYAAMDWLAGRQESIETKLAARHLSAANNPDRLALFDLSSSWVTGTHCALAARGYSRDGKKGLPQIEYGLLTDPVGRPVAVKVFPGNTADPTAFIAIVEHIRTRFHLGEMVMVGDRGMITAARVEALREVGGLGWVTALRAPGIAALAADNGPLQMSLFDHANLAEIAHPDYPGERLIACRNPALAEHRAAKRLALLAATETNLTKVGDATTRAARPLRGADRIGARVGKILGKHKMAKHFSWAATDTTLTFTRDQASIDTEAGMDGIYVIRTSVPAEQMSPAKVVATYKSLAGVERDFRSIKAIDLDLRPIHHHTETRVRGHVFICMLAAYLVWHLRQAWAPLTFTDQNRPTSVDPVAPARRSAAAARKAATKTSTDGALPARSFTGLLDHLATLTRNRIQIAGADHPGFDQLALPTPVQRRAFELLHAPIPLTLTK